ncbi:hypothetical protein [Selenomonas ruminantium]|uniref:hypothetical protein n=1 Tax=Selenomonas ruminantium TaxID=971 RepID=UPI0026F18048|nr:hypothetical protein [Selenomonas ruminantium]
MKRLLIAICFILSGMGPVFAASYYDCLPPRGYDYPSSAQPPADFNDVYSSYNNGLPTIAQPPMPQIIQPGYDADLPTISQPPQYYVIPAPDYGY